MKAEYMDISGAGFSQADPPSDGPSQPPRYTQPYVRWDPANQGNPWSALAAQEADQAASQSSSSGGSHVGAAIAAQTEANMEPKRHRKKVVAILNVFFTTLENFCPVCFFLEDIHAGKLETHTPLVHCARLTHAKEKMFGVGFRSWKAKVVTVE